MIGKNLWDIVYNADLSNWKESMAYCAHMLSRMSSLICVKHLEIGCWRRALAKDASFCYLVGSKLEKVITIWITELQRLKKRVSRISAEIRRSLFTHVLFKTSSKRSQFSEMLQNSRTTSGTQLQTGSLPPCMKSMRSMLTSSLHMVISLLLRGISTFFQPVTLQLKFLVTE